MPAAALVSAEYCLSAALLGVISLSPKNVEEHSYEHSHTPCSGLSSTFADFSQLVCWEEV